MSPSTPSAPPCDDPSTARASPRTGGYEGALTPYFNEIGRYALLTREEEISLARRIRRGDEQAREVMITANLRLVVTIAKAFQGMGVALEDLIQAGNIGLMTASERFDPAFGAKFSVYAANWIKREMRRLLENARVVRVPAHVYEKVRAIHAASHAFAQETGRNATPEDLEALTGMSARKIEHYLTSTRPIASIEAPVDAGGGEARPLEEVVADPRLDSPGTQLERRETAALLMEAMPVLNIREQRIIRERYGLDGAPPRTLDEVGRDLGVSRERVRQLQQAALGKLARTIRANDPEGPPRRLPEALAYLREQAASAA